MGVKGAAGSSYEPTPDRTMTELEAAQFGMKAAALALVDAALRVIEGDPHQFGSRPCSTCTTVSNLVGRPFGCCHPDVAKHGHRRVVYP